MPFQYYKTHTRNFFIGLEFNPTELILSRFVFLIAELEVRFPKFRGTGYIALPVLQDAYKEFSIGLEFKPIAMNGLLLFTAEFENGEKDFFSIALVNGYVEFR